MDVIFGGWIGVRLLNVEFWVEGGDFEKFPVQVVPEFCGDNGMSVFGRKDKVVVAEVYAVVIATVVMWLGHSYMVAERGKLDTGTHYLPRAYARGIDVD